MSNVEQMPSLLTGSLVFKLGGYLNWQRENLHKILDTLGYSMAMWDSYSH